MAKKASMSAGDGWVGMEAEAEGEGAGGWRGWCCAEVGVARARVREDVVGIGGDERTCFGSGVGEM